MKISGKSCFSPLFSILVYYYYSNNGPCFYLRNHNEHQKLQGCQILKIVFMKYLSCLGIYPAISVNANLRQTKVVQKPKYVNNESSKLFCQKISSNGCRNVERQEAFEKWQPILYIYRKQWKWKCIRVNSKVISVIKNSTKI